MSELLTISPPARPLHQIDAAIPAPIPGSISAPEPAPDAQPRFEGLKRFHIETWGCQMNAHDSETMAGVLRSLGMRAAPAADTADIVLLNTCSVREKAAQKVFHRLGRLRRYKVSRPGMILGVCGCVAQQEQEEIFRRAPYVDLVMGPRRIGSLPELIAEARQRRHALAVFDPRDSLIRVTDAAQRVSRTRAWITVMEGCNKNCSFCIVPLTRGRESCRAPEAILQEVRDCIQQGLTEIELLGQNVNAWRNGAWDFTRLLVAVAAEPGVRRVRFTTSHPLHFKNSIIDAMASHGTICPSLHLPVQSGSDRILKLMGRGYTAEDYRGRISRLRERLPGVALSTDVIVGFPGETEGEFDLTLQLVREIRFANVYSFLYSPRPGTPALSWPDDVHLETKKHRLKRLQQAQDAIQMEIYGALLGTTQEVLVEGPAPKNDGQLSGRTPQNIVVNFSGDASLVGGLSEVKILRAGLHSLNGAAENRLTSALSRDKTQQT